mmetsp:Transcript_9595/g.14334  ORF Transcript_9595/g.14334 Transcript_9595/m.14334 type:complete len:135 (+) Transcript_9595:113-517(+)
MLKDVKKCLKFYQKRNLFMFVLEQKKEKWNGYLLFNWLARKLKKKQEGQLWWIWIKWLQCGFHQNQIVRFVRDLLLSYSGDIIVEIVESVCASFVQKIKYESYDWIQLNSSKFVIHVRLKSKNLEFMVIKKLLT